MESIRIATIEEFLSGALPAREGARRLGMHRVSFWRLVKRYEQRGKEVLRHGLTGRRSNRAKPESLRHSVLEAYQQHSASLGRSVHSFYREMKGSLLRDVSYVTVLSWVRS